MTKKITPSMMCADILHIRETLDLFSAEGIEYLHMDVMDGVFVPNLQLGCDIIRQFRAMSDIPLDIHLMITRPEDKLDWFDLQPGEYVSIHFEATDHVQRSLARIRDKGCKPMLALNPATPLSVLEYVVDDCDAVLLMTVNPGFAGQSLIPATIKKIEALRSWLEENERSFVEIEVDGNVSFSNAEEMSRAGANIFVAGSSSVFHGGIATASTVRRLRSAIQDSCQ